MKMFHRLQKGFTMVELLVYMGLLSIVLGVFTAIFVSVLDVQLASEALSSAQQDTRFISARLFRDVNRADGIISPALGDEAESLQLSIDGIHYEYSLDGNGNLIMTDNAGTHALNGVDTIVSNLTFTRIGNSLGKHTIHIDMTITSKVADVGDAETQRLQTTVGLR